MKRSKCFIAALAVFAATVSINVSAQMTNSPPDSYGRWDDQATGIKPPAWIPYTSYGYVGGAVGRSDFDLSGCTPGFSCGDRGTGFKLFTGGQFSRVFGLEAAYVNLGEADRSGGTLRAQGANLSLVATIPLGDRFGIFGKVGGFYGWTRTSAAVPGVATGDDNGLNLSYGAGMQLDLARKWALRGDWDRYRVKYVQGRDEIDLYSLGLVYKF